MDPLIKICGLSTPETLLAALANRAHLVGFIFFPKSPRHVGVAQATGGPWQWR
jgi:phosphoribosylanthranilate isomerase